MASRKQQLVTSAAKVSLTTASKALAGPAGAVATGLLFEAIQGFLQQRTKERTEAFVSSFMESATPEETASPEFQTIFEQAPKETKEVLFLTLKTLNEAVVEECVAPLALLAREYVSTDRPRDRFFINTCRLLRELTTSSQFQSLRTLVHVVHESWRSADQHSMNLERLGPDELIVSRSKFPISAPQDFDDLWRLLGDCHFLETHLETGTGGAMTWGGRQTHSAARSAWDRMVRVLP